MEDNITGFVQMLGNLESAILTKEKDKETPMPEIKDDNPTSKRLKEMLCENTGIHICDSGGDSGRSWQQNRKKDISSQPRIEMTVYSKNGVMDEFYCTINVYHFLMDKAGIELPDKDDKILKLWKKWIAKDETKDMYWPQTMEEFKDFCQENKIDLTGLYGEGSPGGVTNTYNNEDSVSQILQYLYFEYDDQPYALIQIHNGCDARGGYTDPELFKLNNDCGLFFNNDMDIQCSNTDCAGSWQTDDGSHWYRTGGGCKDLKEYTEINVNDKDQMICPECKKGILEAGF